tara:strand:- start:3192 stop:3695 length:504 start_codon:yes stop_codon:yes gene_type:complete
MDYKYISKYQQFSNDELKELENTIIKNHPDDIDNIIEVGTKAGFATLMLSSISKNVITVDEPAFWSPSVRDHLDLNKIHNVKVRNERDILTVLEQEIKNKPEVIYIDSVPNEITPFLNVVKKFQKTASDYKSVTIVYRTEDGFESEKLEAFKKTPKKKPAAEDSVSG